mgnify:FL=1
MYYARLGTIVKRLAIMTSMAIYTRVCVYTLVLSWGKHAVSGSLLNVLQGNPCINCGGTIL